MRALSLVSFAILGASSTGLVWLLAYLSIDRLNEHSHAKVLNIAVLAAFCVLALLGSSWVFVKRGRGTALAFVTGQALPVLVFLVWLSLFPPPAM